MAIVRPSGWRTTIVPPSAGTAPAFVAPRAVANARTAIHAASPSVARWYGRMSWINHTAHRTGKLFVCPATRGRVAACRTRSAGEHDFAHVLAFLHEPMRLRRVGQRER